VHETSERKLPVLMYRSVALVDGPMQQTCMECLGPLGVPPATNVLIEWKAQSVKHATG
jgi:hypothetical protein